MKQSLVNKYTKNVLVGNDNFLQEDSHFYPWEMICMFSFLTVYTCRILVFHPKFDLLLCSATTIFL